MSQRAVAEAKTCGSPFPCAFTKSQPTCQLKTVQTTAMALVKLRRAYSVNEKKNQSLAKLAPLIKEYTLPLIR